MLDIDFLRAPSASSRLVYCYRSGCLRTEMFRALQDIAKAHGLDVALHKPREFTAGLSGFFAALHWCELQGARAAVVENVLHAFTNYTGGPAAIFIKPTRKLLQSELWAQVISQAKVVEEPEPNETTIEAIASYALGRSDLLPPVGLGSDPAFRSHLSTRLPFYLTINDVFQDIDDYILTRDGVSSYATEVEPTAPEQGLVRTLRTFLNEPNAKQERALIGQTLLRGDSELLAIGALTAATAGLIFRSEDESGPADGATTDLVLWATAVLASQLGIAILRGGYAPSWRENPDGRAFAVAQLCRDYRRARVDRDHRAWLVHVAGEALSRVPLLEAGDGTAVRRLGERLKERLSTIEPRSGWLDEVFAALKGTNVVVRSLSPDFRVRWSAISNQRAVVARLCRLIIDDRHQGAILLHGFAPEAKAQIAGAWIKACLCEAPSAGEGCGKCDSCRSLVDGGSPSSGIAHLGTEPRHDKDETGAKAAAEHQVDQVRNLIIDGGLWPGRRVIVLDGVDKVRKGALDRLLKVIEEAPSLVSLVFLAERYGSVPAAIRSRSRASVAVKVSPTTASA